MITVTAKGLVYDITKKNKNSYNVHVNGRVAERFRDIMLFENMPPNETIEIVIKHYLDSIMHVQWMTAQNMADTLIDTIGAYYIAHDPVKLHTFKLTRSELKVILRDAFPANHKSELTEMIDDYVNERRRGYLHHILTKARMERDTGYYVCESLALSRSTNTRYAIRKSTRNTQTQLISAFVTHT